MAAHSRAQAGHPGGQTDTSHDPEVWLQPESPTGFLHKRPEGRASETTSAGSRCSEAKSTQSRADVT